MQITEDIREWDYGNYEGITSAEIKEQRSKAGLEPWDIWRDGCPGGEYVPAYAIDEIGTNTHVGARSK